MANCFDGVNLIEAMDKISGVNPPIDSKVEDAGDAVREPALSGADPQGIVDHNDVIVAHQENAFENACADALLTQIDGQVTYTDAGATHNDAGGLSMYIPSDGKPPESAEVPQPSGNAIAPGPEDQEKL